MKRNVTISLMVLSGLFSMAKAQEVHSCAHVKSTLHHSDRSARLSSHYIDLTEEYDVHFYKLDVNLERTSTDISGAVEIHVNTVAAELDTFMFELHEDLHISEIRLNGITGVPFSREESAVIVPVDFVEGDAFFMRIQYLGTPPGDIGPLDGRGLSNAISPSWGNQVTWSLSQPFAAYEWFPCKQSLTDKADSVCVWVTTDETNMVGSNGLLENVTELPGEKKRYEWKSTYPIDYYLISVAVAEYTEYTIFANPVGAEEPVMIQNFIYNDPLVLTFFESDINETVDYLEHFSTLFGLYPFAAEKYGHSMAPLNGGMEHQTMTTQGIFINWLTAHELGHQWFGDYVTCATWADIWLNEGFASYSEELMMEAFYPGQEVPHMIGRHNEIMASPGGSVWVEDSTNASRIFSGRLTYDKGAAIIHTLRFLINDDPAFFNVLQTYLSTYANGTARAEQFKAIAETITEMDFTAYFNEWYYGEGYPTYSIDYAQVDGEVVVVLDQTTSMPDVVPFFTNDLEIRLTGTGGGVEVVRLSGIDAAHTVHTFPYAEDILSIAIDPNHWIINRDGAITENTALVGLTEAELSDQLLLYPNPVVDHLTIEFTEEGAPFVIYSASGKRVYTGVTQPGKMDLNTENWPAGTYFVRFKAGTKSFTKR